MRLVFAFAAFVAFVNFAATFGSVAGYFSTSCSVAGFDVGSSVGILFKFVIGNNLLLKLLKTFPFALNNNTKLFKK